MFTPFMTRTIGRMSGNFSLGLTYFDYVIYYSNGSKTYARWLVVVGVG